MDSSAMTWSMYQEIPENHSFNPIDWDFGFVADPTFWITASAIFVGGTLANAAGIGGGGIFVALLMYLADFSPRNAIPLSKALIFGGAVMSFLNNIKKTHPLTGQRLVSIDLVMSIVPTACLGTLVGVYLNCQLPQVFIVVCLATILGGITIRTGQCFLKEYRKDQAAEKAEPLLKETKEKEEKKEGAKTPYVSLDAPNPETPATWSEVILLVFNLYLNIFFGTLIHNTPDDEAAKRLAYLAVPAIFSVSLSCYFRYFCLRNMTSAYYPPVSFVGGICSGLFGLGGGIIFSPLMLSLGADPMITVITSSTCVIFTATSTTTQYIAMHRVLLPYALTFGIVTTLSGLAGSKFSMWVMKTFGKGYLLTGIVTLAVGVSMMMTFFKTYLLFHDQIAAGITSAMAPAAAQAATPAIHAAVQTAVTAGSP